MRSVSWTCFKLKRVHNATDYKWKQPSLQITWDHQTGRQLVYLFDFLPSIDRNKEQKSFLSSLPSPEARQNNPFAWHAAFARVVLEQYDEALWLVRDRVRGHEKVSYALILRSSQPPSLAREIINECL
jgi:hypothetical protein